MTKVNDFTELERTLYELLKESLPNDVCTIVKKSIDELESLPYLDDWIPRRTDWFYTIQLIRWGFPFTFFVGNTSVDSLRESVGKTISENGEPEPTKFSEISAVALLAGRGANFVERIQETNSRTPDFKVGWNNDWVELEVTRADQKQAHLDRQNLADQLTQELHQRRHSWDIVVHFTELLSQSEIEDILKASDATSPGNYAEVEGRWRLIAKYPNRPVGQLIVAGEWDDSPSWWPKGLVESYCFAQYADIPDAAKSSPQIRVYFGTPVAAYLNPVRSKADRVQGSGILPFLIAVDVSQLPRGFPVFRQELPNCFITWQQISAVLIFNEWCSFEKIGWTSELIINRNWHDIATYPTLI